MAAGIFTVASLPRLPFPGFLAGVAAAVVALAWIAVAAGLAVSTARHGGLARRTGPVVESFGIGTWVAGTAVFARVLMLATPDDPWPARVLFALAAGLWLWFMPRAVRNLVCLARTRLPPNGIILLATVATQAVALIALRLFPAAPGVRLAAAGLMALGVLCYALAAFLVVRRYAGGGWALATDWANGNCILHGALSITGLTATVSGRFGAGAILALWGVAAAIFVTVEAIEIARVAARVRAAGWRAAVLVYDVSQWARNFTFGMFYAFTLAFVARCPVVASPSLGALRAAVAAYGAYVVLALLLAETALLLFGARAMPIAARPAAAPGRQRRRQSG
ncbi:MAG TPA: hypothetical protein VHW66_20240 [Stellaceae bacterium]|jgi:hypothetical protein|nr:hypothetical protein [Stellaceae bacterium]